MKSWMLDVFWSKKVVQDMRQIDFISIVDIYWLTAKNRIPVGNSLKSIVYVPHIPVYPVKILKLFDK